ncbi:hypothetical protein [Halorarum salinum]|uniref:DUF7964 domain-containing protein n=1 Tax=Halorarum salinum TaxID=2743089 RepID=A0A7D5QIF5_9EURY|nr:hypothetical protein [Halobaculum salinum]QLG62984.1 hypothetical protein HUG12_15090 [Halobaculum salinum]
MRYIKSLPGRPLRAAELDALREAEAIVEAAPLGVADDVIRALAVQVDGTLFGLGYEAAAGWTVVDRRDAGDPEDLAAVRDALKAWAGEQ